jgi:5,10-methylenetetrahydromethanopterin reductase
VTISENALTQSLSTSTSQDGLAPVVDDLSTYVVSGQVVSQPRESQYETAFRTSAQGIDDGVLAERLGFRRVFLSERWNLKEFGSFLGGVAARTSRVDVATGVISPWTRHPQLMAATGATLHACYGPRFVLGLGLGVTSYFHGLGLRAASYDALTDYVQLLRKLWAGEAVAYDGPAGTYERLALGFPYEGPSPLVWFGTFANPKGSAAAAKVMDGVLLPPMLLPEACAAAVQRLHEACERVGRDPASLRIAQSVITAPELDDFETRSLAHGRAVTYLLTPAYARPLADANGWDWKVVERLMAHQQFATSEDKTVDWKYHRVELMEPAKLIPDSWMNDTCALGSVAHCVSVLADYRDAGADEIVIYGSAPVQNAGLIDAWRQKRTP